MVICDWGGWDGLQTVLDHYRGPDTPEAERREREIVEWLYGQNVCIQAAYNRP